MSYPTDTGISYTTKNNGDVIDASHVDNLQTEVQALKTKVGIDSSAVTSTIDYLLKSSSSSDPGHKHTLSSLSDFSVSSPTSGQSLVYNGSQFVNTAGFKFGGTGADGALSITSGTTTIDCANAAVVVKNYTSISITGSGKLAFSNPNTNGTTIILKSQGAVTISSSASPTIDLSGMGGAGGSAANGSGGTNGGGSGGGGASVKSNGSNGVAGFGGATPATGSSGIGGTLYLESCTGGVGGQAGGAQGGTAYNTNISLSNIQKIKGVFMMPGAGGGGGQGNTNDGGAGGAGARGGGALYIECGGTYTCSSTISTAGLVGSAGSPGGTNYAGDGGSGGGGTILILYNTLGSDTGTYTVSGGASSGGGTRRNAGGAGASSVSLVVQNTEFA